MKLHLANLRLRVNAGMNIPECKAHAELLDTDSGRWPMTTDRSKVTCAKCKKAEEKGTRTK